MTPEEYDRHYRKREICGNCKKSETLCVDCYKRIILPPTPGLSDEHYRLMRMQDEKNKKYSQMLNLVIEKSQKEAAILAEYERQMT